MAVTLSIASPDAFPSPATETRHVEPIRLRLTKSSVAALKPDPDRMRVVWDSTLIGLGVRVMPSGIKAYFLQRRTKTGRAIKLTIGRANRITAEQAREKARELIAAMELGRDPARELEAAREAQRSRRGEATVAALFGQWMSEHAIPNKRASSVENDRLNFRRHAEPALGRMRVKDVSTDHLRRLHGSIGARYAANRTLALISTLFNFAIQKGLRPDNPARGVRPHREHRRERFLSVEELGRLLAVLERRDDLPARCLAFLAVTGARRGETLAMRWGDADIAAGTWTKRPETTKSGKRHVVPLSPSALRILHLVRAGSLEARVFPVDRWKLHSAWISACAEARVEGARLHDLRHAFVTTGIAAGVPPAVMVQLAGHHDLSMTSRYAHAVDAAQRADALAVAEQYEKLLADGKVVPLKRGA